MGRVKDNYYSINKPCYGAYQPSQLCDHCWAAELCKEETIHLDGYYDELAEKESIDMWEGVIWPL